MIASTTGAYSEFGTLRTVGVRRLDLAHERLAPSNGPDPLVLAALGLIGVGAAILLPKDPLLAERADEAPSRVTGDVHVTV